MENKKHIGKVIIAFLIIICVVASVIIFHISKNNNNQNNNDAFVSSYSEEESQNSSKESAKAEKNVISNTSVKNESSTNEVIIEAGGTDKVNISNKEGTGGVGIKEGNGNAGYGNYGTDGIGTEGNINTNATGNSGVFTGNDTDVNNGSGIYANDSEIEESTKIGEISINQNRYVYEDEEEETPKKDNFVENDKSIITLKNNEFSNIDFKINLLNAPYNNNEYCERKLSNNYKVELVDKPEGSSCSNYPNKLVVTSEGKLNEAKHSYTKVGNLDFSNAKFNSVGDYYFNVCDEETNTALYQIMVTFRYVTDSNGVPTNKTYSLIQLKSLVDGKKVDNLNIDVLNPNTSITVDKVFNPNSFLERVYLDVYIDSYKDDIYTVLDGNSENLNSKIGEFVVVRDENGNIIPQICKFIKGGKIIIGKRDDIIAGIAASVATEGDISDLGLSADDLEKLESVLEIPAGTKYKVSFSSGKKYREEYAFEGGGGEFVEAGANPEINEVVLVNVTETNPKTGIFYSVAPFVIVITIAIAGIIIIKRTSYKDDDK